jgi:glycosidase
MAASGNAIWQCGRSWEKENLYFLLIDRFHDGAARKPVQKASGYVHQDKVKLGGNLRGIKQQLPFLHALGITAIWISPPFHNTENAYHGYAIKDFLNVDPSFGSNEELKLLIEAAHEMGIRVIIDIVLNHTGDVFDYVDLPTQKIAWREMNYPLPIELRNENLYSRRGAISNWEDPEERITGDIFELKDLAWHDPNAEPQLSALFLAIYTYWMDYTDCDGFRIDTVKHLPPEAYADFCRGIRAHAEAKGKDFLLIAECLGDETLIASYPGGQAFLDFPSYFLLPNVLRGISSIEQIEKRFQSSFLQHQMPVTFLDNHDQVGQLIKGRFSSGLDESSRLAYLMILSFLPGMPCFYYGTEFGLSGQGFRDEHIRECLFNPNSEEDLFDLDNRTVQEFASLLHFRNEMEFTNSTLTTAQTPITPDLLWFRRETTIGPIICAWNRSRKKSVFLESEKQFVFPIHKKSSEISPGACVYFYL